MGKKLFTLLTCLSLVISMVGVVSCSQPAASDTSSTGNDTTNNSGGSTTVAVTGVSLSESVASVLIGKTMTLTATVAPDNATNKGVTWSTSNKDIATVDNGVVTGVAVGTVDIVATSAADSKMSATCKMTVTKEVIPVTGITISKETASMIVGESVTLSATIAPDIATDKSYTWASSDNKVATVDKGVVKAISKGTADISVTSVADSTKTAKCTVTVSTVAVKSISLVGSPTKIATGSVVPLTVTLDPLNATIVSSTVTSTNSDVAKADQTKDGVTVTGVKPGTADITLSVTDADGNTVTSSVLAVTVADVAPTGVTLSDTAKSLYVKGTVTLTATVAPVDATNKAIEWASGDPSVATVADGVVTAVAAGSTKITATSKADNTLSASCDITVTVPVSAISVTSAGGPSIKVGDKLTLTAAVTPDNATNKNITWASSNPSVATVANGEVTGIGGGTAVISAASVSEPTVKGTFSVTVIVPVTGITIATAGNVTQLDVGKSLALTATVSPTNATDTNVTWSSSSVAYATVSSSGIVKAKSAGPVTITATSANGVSAEITLTLVDPIPVINTTSSKIEGAGVFFYVDNTALPDKTDFTVTGNCDASKESQAGSAYTRTYAKSDINIQYCNASGSGFVLYFSVPAGFPNTWNITQNFTITWNNYTANVTFVKNAYSTGSITSN